MKNRGYHLYPADEREMYPFLFNVTKEWEFFADAETLGIPDVTPSTLKGATLVRDEAVEMWNRWMQKQLGRDWWLVYQRYNVEKNFFDEKRGMLLTAGTKLLVVHRCESVLAAINRIPHAFFDPDGRELALGEKERVELHCILAPPRDDTLKMLPINAVPKVTPFNH